MRRTTGVSIRCFVLGVTLLLAACGKVGSPDIPAGSTYPKIYPLNARPSNKTAELRPSGQAASFTASGAWIDQAQRRPIIDPEADVDQKGSGAASGVGGPVTGNAEPANKAASGGPSSMPAP